jgi:membrane protease subunit (stomatin/prohibitin family)
MLTRLKNGLEAAGGTRSNDVQGIKQAIDELLPGIKSQIFALKQFKAAELRDNQTYEDKVITPILLTIKANDNSGCVLIPRFDERFAAALWHLRDELLVFKGNQVSLVEGYNMKLSTVLTEGFQLRL